MAAALQSCGGLVPSPTSTLSSSRRPSSMQSLPTIVAVPAPAGRRRLTNLFPGLKLHQAAAGSAAALPLCPRVVAVRAHQNAQQPPQRRRPSAVSRHFAEEREHVMERYADIIDIDDGCLYVDANAMSAQVCLSANTSLEMASRVMDAAYLKNLDAAAPNGGEISTHTIYRTLVGYVDTFVDAADASYGRAVTRKTVTSFLGALRGLASVSHILLESALEALAATHPREAVAEYTFNCDVENMRRELHRRMDGIEDGVRKASGVEICRLAVPAIHEGMKITGSFVGLMVARRKRALGKAQTTAPIAVQ